MYCGWREFSVVEHWLRGIDFAVSNVPTEPKDLDGFREWLHMTLEGACNVDWVSLIRHQFGDGDEATKKMFEQFDLFRKDVADRGLPAIIKEHQEYEIRRHGSPPISSRPGGIAWRSR